MFITGAHVLWHSGDLPRSVQRQRRSSKQVWRWKKHVITWLLFLCTREVTRYSRRTFFVVSKLQTTWLAFLCRYWGALFASHARRRKCTTMCGRKNESLTLWQKKVIYLRLFPLFLYSFFKKVNAYTRTILNWQLSFFSLLRFCSHSWVNRVKDAQKDTVITNIDSTVDLTYQGLVWFHQLNNLHRFLVLVHLQRDVRQPRIVILLRHRIVSAEETLQ